MVWILTPYARTASEGREPIRYDGGGPFTPTVPEIPPTQWARDLRAAIRHKFSRVPSIGINHGGHRGFVTIRGERQNDLHSVGRALDVMLPSNGSPLGLAIANWCVENAEQYHIQLVIHDHRVWQGSMARNGDHWPSDTVSVHRRFDRYTGPNPHTDHVHVEVKDGAVSGPANPETPAIQPTDGTEDSRTMPDYQFDDGTRYRFEFALGGNRRYMIQAGNTEDVIARNVRNAFSSHGVVHDIHVIATEGPLITEYHGIIDWTPATGLGTVTRETADEWVLYGANYQLHNGDMPPTGAWITHPNDWLFAGAWPHSLAVISDASISPIDETLSTPLPQPRQTANAVDTALSALDTVHDSDARSGRDGHSPITNSIAENFGFGTGDSLSTGVKVGALILVGLLLLYVIARAE